MLMLSLIAHAAALEGQPGTSLPGATALAPRQGWITAGAAWSWPGSAEQGAQLRGVVGLGNRTALSAEGHLRTGGPLTIPGIGLRTIAIRQDGFSLAPFAQLSFSGSGMSGLLGLAGVVDGQKADLDASVGLIGLAFAEGASTGTVTLPPASMTAMDLGVTLQPAAGQELRVGLLSSDRVRFSLGYRWLGQWWLVSGDVLYWPGDTGARAMAGLRF